MLSKSSISRGCSCSGSEPMVMTACHLQHGKNFSARKPWARRQPWAKDSTSWGLSRIRGSRLPSRLAGRLNETHLSTIHINKIIR